ncbi:MAG: thioesterase family protein [Polaromonas sp.]|nr:thioesterase family protein [Polaromonas sp.]
MSSHPFDSAVALQVQADGSFLGHTSTAYANMVGPFGGITAAQALNAVLQHSQRLGDPISLTVNFAAAVADGPFTVSARPARTNRSTQHWVLEMQQNGETVLTGTAFLGLRRDTWGADEHTMPEVPASPDVARATGPARVEWVKRYEMRFIEGAIPLEWHGADQGASRTRLWLRDDPPRPLDFASLTALSDVFFPRVWRRRPLLVPIGTVSMTVYYHADAALLQSTGSGYLLGQTQAQAFRNGYFDQTAQLWNEGGALLVTTHQVVYYKE